MFVYVLYVGDFNSISAQLYNIFSEEYLAEQMGQRLTGEGGYDYYYVTREPLIREIVY